MERFEITHMCQFQFWKVKGTSAVALQLGVFTRRKTGWNKFHDACRRQSTYQSSSDQSRVGKFQVRVWK